MNQITANHNEMTKQIGNLYNVVDKQRKIISDLNERIHMCLEILKAKESLNKNSPSKNVHTEPKSNISDHVHCSNGNTLVNELPPVENLPQLPPDNINHTVTTSPKSSNEKKIINVEKSKLKLIYKQNNEDGEERMNLARKHDLSYSKSPHLHVKKRSRVVESSNEVKKNKNFP